eukprot:GDKI01022732.1.p1 GENE.GDKI01022732.1~~GDKI01022732.1.p1  ORF type:complete len:195 (-),score=59.64 GDKI01022732.1:492-1076(-)
MRHVRTELLLKRIKDPSQIPVCVHGTYLKNWLGIRKIGLHRMQRNHIHFAPGLLDASEVVSGMRQSCDVAIFIDVNKAFSDNIAFFRASNQVILTEGVSGSMPPQYFEKVLHLAWNVVLWERGEDKTELYKHLVPRDLLQLSAVRVWRAEYRSEMESLQASPHVATPSSPNAMALEGGEVEFEMQMIEPLDLGG